MKKYDITSTNHTILKSSMENDFGYIKFIRSQKEHCNKPLYEIQNIIQSLGYKFKQLTYTQMLHLRQSLKLEFNNFSLDILTGLYNNIFFFKNDKAHLIGFKYEILASSVNMSVEDYISQYSNQKQPKIACKILPSKSLYETIIKYFKII
mgnify:CR=1 FL=1